MSGRKRPMAPETPDSTPGPRRSGRYVLGPASITTTKLTTIRTQHTPALKTLYDMKYHKMMEHTSSTRAKKLRHAHGDYSQLNDHLNDDEDPLSSVEPPQSSPPKKKSKKLDRMPPPPPPKPDNKRSHPSRPKMKKSSDAAAEQIDDGEADVPTFGKFVTSCLGPLDITITIGGSKTSSLHVFVAVLGWAGLTVKKQGAPHPRLRNLFRNTYS